MWKIFKKVINVFRPLVKTKKRIALLVVLILVGFYFYNRSQASKNLQTYTVSKRDVTQVVSASGKVAANQVATLNFPANGKLAWVKVSVGDEVRAWQGLLGMDTQDLNAAYTAAYYSYLSADANAKQVEDEVKDHDGDETFEQKNKRVAAQTARDAAYDSWKAAERDLKDATLVSPFAGIVSELTVNTPGDTITVADGVTIINPSTIYFRAEIDEVDLGKVKVGQEVSISLDAFSGRELRGVVERIDKVATVSPTGGVSVIAKVKFNDTDDLVVNLNGEARIITNKFTDVLAIPREYLVNKDDRYFVELKDAGEREVILGETSEGMQIIEKGLSTGDVIVLR